MTLRKVLLYGGCHALVLRDLLTACLDGDVETTLIVNFDLIQRGVPFPYERLNEFDVVFYSPIENKGEYNTSHLAEACRGMGVDAFCYPWLEWHGYCPGAAKAVFKNRFQWRYRGLAEAASSFDSFDDFFEWAVEAFPDDVTIKATFAETTALVRAAEERHAMPIRVSDFILDRYRSSRLFLVSDHPSLALYLDVLRQMLGLIGFVDGGKCTELAQRLAEPQSRWRTPILPRVERVLDLRFSDTRWIDEDIVPERSLDLRSYLLLYYYGDSVILGPVGNASISPVPAVAGERQVEAATRLVADRIGGRAGDPREEYRLLEVLAGGAMPLERDQRFEIDNRQWRSAWG